MIHLKFGNSLHRFYYNQVIRRLSKRANCILTVSEYSRRQILDWSGLPQDKVVSIPLGIGAEFREDGPIYHLAKRYILYVGNRRIYKNLDRMIRAFSLATRDSGIVLALTGNYDSDLYALAVKHGAADRLVFLGVVTEEQLPGLYRGALALMYISLFEGFGLPPLEAIACGTPVVVSNTTSLPEVVGQAALLVDPTNVACVAAALERAINDRELRVRLRHDGLEQARKFSWDSCATSTWQHILATCPT
jgi:glycosyltransferase involved in cell wall biosynthesis